MAIEGRQVLLEIHPCLQLGQLIQQPLAQGADAPLQPTIDPRHGQLGRAPAAGRDHLADRLGPGEVEPTVEESPLAELPGQGPPRPG